MAIPQRLEATGAIRTFSLRLSCQTIRKNDEATSLRQIKRARAHYTIHAIELARTCVRSGSAVAPLYVGQTAHTPEHRFAQHKQGGKRQISPTPTE